MHLLIDSLVIAQVKEMKFNLLHYMPQALYLYCILIYLIHLSCLNFLDENLENGEIDSFFLVNKRELS